MQVSKARQESIARAEMIYTQIQLAIHIAAISTLIILQALNKVENWFDIAWNLIILGIAGYLTIKANSKAWEARSKWKELTE